LEEAVAIVTSAAMAFVRDATALGRTATLERALHYVRLAKGQANASCVKEEDGNHPGSFLGLTACSPMTSKVANAKSLPYNPPHESERGVRLLS